MSTPWYAVYTINHATMTQYLRGEYTSASEAIREANKEVGPRVRSYIEACVLHVPTSKKVYSIRGGY